jgi:thiamine-monophosphate kinase
MKEFDYIRWLRQKTPADPRILVGPGDDCAVLQPSQGPLLVTTDMLLEEIHFRLAEVGPRRVGRKVMAVNLSDIAAMAGKPLAAVVSVGLPKQSSVPRLAEELYEGMRELADAFATAIVGGDTNAWDGGLTISLTMLGEAQPPGPVLRSGAHPGDWLLVTGPLGGSILGHHLDFTPRVREATQLHQLTQIHAMIDISDGLAADLQHICEESGCGAILEAEAIPLRAEAHQLGDHLSPLEHALRDGEDFELLLALEPTEAKRLLQSQPVPGIQLFHIGECRAEGGMFLREKGQVRPLAARGYVHEA